MTSLPTIQECLIPRRPSSRYGAVEVAHLWLPLDEIGGDFLYYEQIAEQFLSVEVGDVIGHGTHAGLVMTALHGLLFGLRQQVVPLDIMLANANDFLWRLQQTQTRQDPDRQVRLLSSMFLLRVDFKSRTLTYCNAGHPAALYLPNDADSEVLSMQSGGLILGAIPGAKYQAAQLRPQAGDTILLFTDGLSETRNEAGEELGSTRLESLLQELQTLKPREIVEQVETRVAQFRGNAEITDDIAVAVLQFGNKWSQ